MIESDMLETLSLDDKILFLRMIIHLIGSDGKIEQEERVFMKELARQYHIPKQYSEQINVKSTEEQLLADCADKLDRKKSLYLIKELLTVANTDSSLDDREIDFVIKVSNTLKIEDARVAEINQLVLEQIAWVERYQRAMEIDQ